MSKINTNYITYPLIFLAIILSIFGGFNIKNIWINKTEVRSLSTCLEYSDYCTAKQYKQFQDEAELNASLLKNEQEETSKKEIK